MAKNKAEERQKKIVDLITAQGTMRIADLAAQFNVSRETIRRDLHELDKSGVVKKWYGTVMPAQDFNDAPVAQRMHENESVKIKICQKALSLLAPHSLIFIDAGSTLQTFAKILSDYRDFTVITNSFPVVNELADSNNSIISVGGSYDPLTASTIGSQALNFIDKIKINYALLGTSGFAEHQGPTINSFDGSEIKKKIIENSRVNIVLADSSKASYSSLTQYTDWHNIDYLVTDKNLPPKIESNLSKLTDVIIA
ncbi:DeoR/GlpR transcriptional regulator [Lactiplantibacillus pentosus]|uniref:Transcriptional regulator, DeoR family n=1 Tax=Lactiplantibacillus pentosus IG1 TaxID=1042160 RepID=G0M4K1_LACPE|nr:DeoR/GlpR family DNA-binding transcription regulator [Lactiplantibacillus pentosus]CCC17127.1 transcriptional regulator, DeoR family [Lactiplantibacillus pentosus IG1]MCT3303363.1 DeoR/GlpR transcriptional regulator [Lactiplantibacillus pentosus]PRO79930.1 DeoR/GlpR transcriptional regulator [Lactiplantibacillus pentosus]PRO82695.1 DeoR/GlpR transcriptional regulator [Lactiplantibacillus pentosus]PRO93494.1 DeoR/GlpR transcriptional regulator [Lactiplantibacillus pentosus]